MSIMDIILTVVGVGLIVLVFLFAWSMYMLIKADNKLRKFLEHKERFERYKGEL